MKCRPSGRTQKPDGSITSGQPGRAAGLASTNTERARARTGRSIAGHGGDARGPGAGGVDHGVAGERLAVGEPHRARPGRRASVEARGLGREVAGALRDRLGAEGAQQRVAVEPALAGAGRARRRPDRSTASQG